MMERFDKLFLEVAEKETRCVIIPPGKSLPEGEYFFIESYCNDPKCDCRRVFINVLHKENIVATIGYGWEDLEFYEEWMRDKLMAKDAKGPILELGGQQSVYAEELLKLFTDLMLKDTAFIEKLQKHYRLFKESADKNVHKNSDAENLDVEDVDQLPLHHLCGETGTGSDAINDSNREAFMPILLVIEETIWRHFSEDASLKDSDIIKSLKKLRDNIFSQGVEFDKLEDDIDKKIKAVLSVNDYNRRDVSLSISSVLNSVRRHKALNGKRGYLNFISSFFEEMQE